MLDALPDTEWLDGAVELDRRGFVRTGPGLVTTRPGVFAVGDVRAGSVKRAWHRPWAKARSSSRPSTRRCRAG